MSSSGSVRVVQIVPFFPSLTETAILVELLGLQRLGIEQSILSFRPRTALPTVPEAKGLMPYVRYLDGGDLRHGVTGGLINLLSAFPALARHGAWLMLNRAWGGAGLARAARLVEALCSVRPDIVHVHFAHIGVWLMPVAKAMEIPMLVSCRGRDMMLLGREHRRKRDALFQSAARFLVRCSSMADDLRSMGCPPGKIKIHYSPIEIARFPFRERSTPGPDEKVTILMVGRLVEKKGMDIGLRAFASCGAVHSSVTMRIVGEGPEEKRLRMLACELGIERRVEFLGALSHEQTIAEMQKAHIFLCPSRTASDGDREGIPNALKEAAACGLPVVASSHAGIPECVEDGVSGLLSPEGDPAALAKKLDVLIRSPELWPAMGRAGRRIVETKFDVTSLSLALLEEYRSHPPSLKRLE